MKALQFDMRHRLVQETRSNADAAAAATATTTEKHRTPTRQQQSMSSQPLARSFQTDAVTKATAVT